MTICCMGDIEVTFKDNNSVLEVTFERANGRDFQTAVFSIDGTILSNVGYGDADLVFLHEFVLNNAKCIKDIYDGKL